MNMPYNKYVKITGLNKSCNNYTVFVNGICKSTWKLLEDYFQQAITASYGWSLIKEILLKLNVI